MALTTYAKNLAVGAVRTAATYVSLHTVDTPDSSGSSEVSGGSPAYARKAATWDAVASGAFYLTSSLVFDVPGGTTVKSIGLWTASSGGTFLGSYDCADQTSAGQFTVTVTTAFGVTST